MAQEEQAAIESLLQQEAAVQREERAIEYGD